MSNTTQVSAAVQKHVTPLLAGITTAAFVANPLREPPVAGYNFAVVPLLLITDIMSPSSPVGNLTPFDALSQVTNVVFVNPSGAASDCVLPVAATEAAVTLA
jgi:hypothetical protein